MSGTLSIRDELAKLKPVDTDLTVTEARALAASLRQRWEELGAVQTGAVESGLEPSSAELETLRSRIDDMEYETKMRLGAVLSFGEVLDDLTAVAERSGDPEIKAGIARVAEKARSSFGKFGLEEVTATPGSRFNEELHEAVTTVPAGGGRQSGTIVEVMQRGYRHGGSVFRRAQVAVAR